MTTVSDAEGGVAHATGGAKPEHHDNDRGRLYAANAQVGANASDDESSEAIPPFPYFYIFLLCLSLLSNALYVTSLFPYLPDLTHDMTGLPETAVGYRAGFIASSFMVGRMLSSSLWGPWSDRHGRRPVLVIGCLTIAITSVAFGFSFAYWWTIVIRFLGGLGNGITAAAKTCTAEVAPHSTHRSKAMSVVTASWGLGLVLGPAIGGMTSHWSTSSVAALRALAPEGSLLNTFPYLVPNVIIATLAVGSAVAIQFRLPETLKRSNEHSSSSSASSAGCCGIFGRRRRKNQRYQKLDASDQRGQAEGGVELAESRVEIADAPANNDKGVAEPVQSQYDRPLYRQPTVLLVVAAYTLLSFVQIVFDECFPLWSEVSTEKHGLGMDASEIGVIMTAMGAALLLFQAFVFPRISKAFGTRQTFVWASMISVPIMAAFPLVIYAPTYVSRFAAIVLFSLFKNGASVCAFTCVFLLTNNSVPMRRRGAVNGFSMTIASLGKAAAPAVAGNLFAWSMENGLPFPLDYHLVYIICAALSLLLGFLVWKLPLSLEQPCVEDQTAPPTDPSAHTTTTAAT